MQFAENMGKKLQLYKIKKGEFPKYFFYHRIIIIVVVQGMIAVLFHSLSCIL